MLVVTLIMNTLATVGVLNGMTQKQVSDLNDTLITPSGLTFSIWAVLYTLMIICVIILFVKKDDPYYQRVTEKTSLLFWLSCIFNIAWTISFSYLQIGLSTIFIIGLLISLMLLTKKISELQVNHQWLFPLTVGLYAGWIFIATVVNIAAWLVNIEWGALGMSHDAWAIIIAIIATALAILVSLDNRNAFFTLPIAWAFLGIRNARAEDGGHGGVKVVSLIMMAILLVWVGIQLFRNDWHLAPAHPAEEPTPAEENV
ncbi:MAG: TspO/MBR family protein [Saccharofermentanales bacterium]